MVSSSSTLVNNLSEGIHRIKFKCGHNYEKWETCGMKYATNCRGDLIEYKCFFCNKHYQNKFYEKLKERFFNTYKFSDHGNNKFVLLLQKGVYLCEYMDD